MNTKLVNDYIELSVDRARFALDLRLRKREIVPSTVKASGDMAEIRGKK